MIHFGQTVDRARHKRFWTNLFLISGLLALITAHHCAMAEPSPAAVSAFENYLRSVESRLTKQHQSTNGFLAPPLSPQDEQRLRKGELIIQPITPLTGLPLPGALLHDWRGTAFAAGAKAADFERLMRNINAYP